MGKAVTIGFGLILLAGALVWFFLNFSIDVHGKRSGSKTPAEFALSHSPVEFLYLDSTRVLGYAYQLEGGEKGPVRRIAKNLESVKAEASAGGINVGASTQEEEEVESTLTPAVSSEMWILLKDLLDDTERGSRLHYVTLADLEAESNKKKIREGWLVHFSTRHLLSPGYIRPYVILRHAATRAALFPLRAGNAVTEDRAREQRRRAAVFAKQIGPNPRFTFAITSPGAESQRGKEIKVLMPVQYKDLTTERSMFEKERGGFTGGELSVIGKVVRVFPERDCPGPHPYCKRPARPVFTDLSTRETWQRPIEQASNYLVDKVSHRCKAVSRKHPDKRIEGKSCFLARLKRDTRLSAPGMVILPIAVYK